MKLYDFAGAPNPRRVKIFAAEKGIDLELVPTDMSKGEHKTPAFLQKNPSGKLPVLETDAGECIAESVAICRYLEALYPEPNLFGADPVELGQIEMVHRHIELELFSQIGTSWVNGPVVGKLFAGQIEQIPAAKEKSDAGVNRYYQRIDNQLAECDYIAGDRFTIVDITTLVAIDFAGSLVGLKPDESLDRLWAWHARVSARPSCQIQ